MGRWEVGYVRTMASARITFSEKGKFGKALSFLSFFFWFGS